MEPIEPEGLEVLAPPSVQHALGIGELSRLGFGATLPARSARGSGWRATGWTASPGCWVRKAASGDALCRPRQGRPAIRSGCSDTNWSLDNATFRLLEVAPAWTRYLVLDFRASAVSDDKRDWMVRLGVNLATGALPDAVLSAIAPVIEEPLR